MTIADMHYDFKKKLNKVDSQQNRNLLVPEIDWALNEAMELYIKMVAQPRIKSHLGFEKIQRNRDDIRTIVKSVDIEVEDNIVKLPEDYLFWLRARVLMDKIIEGKVVCEKVEGIVMLQRHDNTFEESSFHRSSFEWREVNAIFITDGIQLFDDGTFKNKNLLLSYISKPPYIHNAKAFGTKVTNPETQEEVNGYKLPSGEVLFGSQDCRLPEHTHKEIVDLAVALVSGELNSMDYPTKLHKLSFNELK